MVSWTGDTSTKTAGVKGRKLSVIESARAVGWFSPVSIHTAISFVEKC